MNFEDIPVVNAICVACGAARPFPGAGVTPVVQADDNVGELVDSVVPCACGTRRMRIEISMGGPAPESGRRST